MNKPKNRNTDAITDFTSGMLRHVRIEKEFRVNVCPYKLAVSLKTLRIGLTGYYSYN
jgi:hypothetical protein